MAELGEREPIEVAVPAEAPSPFAPGGNGQSPGGNGRRPAPPRPDTTQASE
jgi:hypothetical protein